MSVKKYCLTNGNIVWKKKKGLKGKVKPGLFFLVRFQNLFLAGISEKNTGDFIKCQLVIILK